MASQRLFALLASLGIAGGASASFQPSDWTLVNRLDTSPLTTLPVGAVIGAGALGPIGGNGTLDTVTMSIVGGNSGHKGLTLFEATALTAGTLTCSWTYSGFDMACWDNGGFLLGSQFTVIACNQTGPFSGTLTLTLQAGDTVGFGVRTGDGLEGAGHLTVTDLAFTGTFVPAPAGVAALVAAGLTGRRRRR